jgi:hypothetical protein
MSLSWPDSPRIVLIAPVSTAGEAAASAAAGAGLVDVGDADALIKQIRDLVGDVRICGRDEDADIVRDAGIAVRTGAGLICPDPDAAARAVRGGVPAERILVRTAPARLETVVRAGWATLVDLDEHVGLGQDIGLDEHVGLGQDIGLDEHAGTGQDVGLDGHAGTGQDVSLDGHAGTGGDPLARAEAVAAVCAWLGARVIRTRYVAEIRRCVDMTESILGRRPPAWTVRGLA